MSTLTRRRDARRRHYVDCPALAGQTRPACRRVVQHGSAKALAKDAEHRAFIHDSEITPCRQRQPRRRGGARYASDHRFGGIFPRRAFVGAGPEKNRWRRHSRVRQGSSSAQKLSFGPVSMAIFASGSVSKVWKALCSLYSASTFQAFLTSG